MSSATSPLDGVAAYLTRVIDASSERALTASFRAHQRRLGLDRLTRAATDLEAVGAERLRRCLRDDPDHVELRALVERSRQALSTNPCLHAYLDALADVDTPALDRRVEREGERVLADVLCYALVLERVTRAARADPRIVRALLAQLRAARAELPWRRFAPAFLVVKFHSVEVPLRRMLARLEAGAIEPDFGRWALALNIAEASFVDQLCGRRDNAAVGWLLARRSAGRAYLSSDGAGIAWSRPAAKAWADLYTAWDIEFIIGLYANFPYVLAKLLIPAVAGYADDPDGYIYARCIALYLQLNWGVFSRCELRGELNLDWPHAELAGPGAVSIRACADQLGGQR